MKTSVLNNIFFLLLVSAILFSCSQKQPVPIWEVSKKDCPKSYIIGITDHLNKNEDAEIFSDTIFYFFDNSELLITQIDEKNSNLNLIMEELEIGNEKTLKDILSEKDFLSLKNKKQEFDREVKNNFSSPDSAKIKLIFYLQDLLFSSKKDKVYFELIWKQRNSKKDKVGLETREKYHATLGNLKIDKQLDLLRSIDNFDDFSKDFSSEINSLYTEGNYTEVQNSYLKNFHYLKTNYNRFFTKKHETWMVKLDSNFTRKSCFLSLDILHLVGKNNILDMLKEKGYTVKKVQQKSIN